MKFGTFLLATISLVALSEQRAVAQGFNIGDNVASFSVGVGGNYGASSSYSSQTPALGLGYERGVMDLGPGVLGIGGYLGYKSLAHRYAGPGYEYDWSWRYLIMGVRGNWHYNEWHGIDELDVYGGLLLSYNSVKWTDNTRYPANSILLNQTASSGIGLSALLGARYYFTESLAGQLELGYGISYASIGLAYKF